MEQNYFNKTLKTLEERNFQEVTFVIGNESCDVDSAVCAIVYATYLTWHYAQTRDSGGEDTVKKLFIPMLNINRYDYRLKTDVVFLFKSLRIRERRLIFKDDIHIDDFIESKVVNIILVDHHTLVKWDTYLRPYVKEIIDHRPVDEKNWLYLDNTEKLLESVGSCSTLITKRILQLNGSLENNVSFFKVYPTCCELLHCAIILDTLNFSDIIGKGTDLDKEMLLHLESQHNGGNVLKERLYKLNRLLRARCDVSALTSYDILHKDLKIVSEVYVASLPMLVEEFLQRRDSRVNIYASVIRAESCSMGVFLGQKLHGNGETSRDVLLYAVDENMLNQLSDILIKSSSPNLELEYRPMNLSPRFSYYTQLNVRASRKQYIQIINEKINVPAFFVDDD